MTTCEAGFQARPYQNAALDAIEAEFSAGKTSTLAVLPTGCGKTILFGMLAAKEIERGGRVLILAHRGELLEQAVAKLDFLGVDVVIEKADQDALRSIAESERSYLARPVRCVAASVQTLHERRLARWKRDYFSLLITDEAHHAPAESYQRIYQHFVNAKHLGVTATADRLDGENLGGVYQSLAFEYRLDEAIKDGWLARLEWSKCPVEVDLKGIRTTGGDFNLGDLEERISQAIEPLVNGTVECIGERRAIVFTPDVGSAEAFAAGLRRIGVSARSVNGQSYDREAILHGFAEGDFQVLCNCALLTEGYDAPFVEAVVLARPTKSRSLMAQLVGRGTRLYPGKECCQVVDFAWLIDRHRLVSPVELIAPELADDRLRQIALELVSSGDAKDVLDAMEYAGEIKERQDRAEAERKAEAERLRLNVRKLPTGFEWETFDPLNARSSVVMGLEVKETFASKRLAATDRQVNALVSFGVPHEEASAMSRRAASQHLDWLCKRADERLCTLKQLRVLLNRGIAREVALGFTKAEASDFIDRNKWHRSA